MKVWYGLSLYRSKSIKYLAKKYLEVLPKDVTVLVSLGSSGNSIASAMLCLSESYLEHLHLRKEKEESHSGSAVGRVVFPSDVFAIVDDFIDTGKTIDYILERIEYFHCKTYIIVHEAPSNPETTDKELFEKYNNLILIMENENAEKNF